MTKTLLVAGYGPGISHAVAEKFGAAGFSVILLARNEANLATGAKQLEAKQIKALALPTDVGNPAAIRAAVQKARAALGPITALHWNAAAPLAGDLLTAPLDQLRSVFDVGVIGLVSAVQETVEDLRKAKGAVLVTNGGFGLFDSNVDGYAVRGNNMGLAVGNSAKHKTVRVLAKRLESEGIYVGEVMVISPVKGTPWDDGTAKLAASDVAQKFWQLFERRTDTLAQIG